MRNILTISLMLAVPVLAFAQPDSLWSRTFGGSSLDGCQSVQQTSDGGYVLAGYTESFGSGGKDFWLVKTDTNGDSLWSRTYGGPDDEVCTWVDQTSDGGYVLGGYTISFGAGDKDFWLVKTNSEGDSLWSRTYGESSVEYCNSGQECADGGFVLTGTKGLSASAQFWLVKTDSQGDTLWTRAFGSYSPWGYGYRGQSVRQTTDGGYLLAGYYNGWYGICSPCIVKTDYLGNGSLIGIHGNGNIQLYSAWETDNGDFIVAGRRRYSVSRRHLWLARTNSSGERIWEREFGGDNYEACHAGHRAQDGGHILGGVTRSFGAGGYDFWLVKTDGSGTEEWSRTFGGSSVDWCYSVQQTTDGGYILGGYTYSYGAGAYDFWLVKTGPEGGIPLIQDGDILLNTMDYELTWEPYSHPDLDRYEVRFTFVPTSSSFSPWDGWESYSLFSDGIETMVTLTPDFPWADFGVAGQYDVEVLPLNQWNEVIGTALLNYTVTYGRVEPDSATDRDPVVLLHGLNSNRSAWDSMEARFIEDDRYQPFIVEYPNTGDIKKSAGVLSEALQYISGLDGVPEGSIRVVAHSMGGLVARAYTAGLATNATGEEIPFNDDMHSLAMIATPNRGGRFAAIADFFDFAETPAYGQLTPGSGFLIELNTQDLPDFPLLAMAGFDNGWIEYCLCVPTIDAVWCNPVVAEILEMTILPNDFLVTVNSALMTINPLECPDIDNLQCYFIERNHCDIRQPSDPGDDRFSVVKTFLDGDPVPPSVFPVGDWITGFIAGLLPLLESDSLAGAPVMLISESDTFYTLTDETGYYEFPFVLPGTYRLEASAAGFITDSATIELDEEIMSVQHDFVLPPDPEFDGPVVPSISINDAASYTTSLSVTLNLDVSNAMQVMVSESPNLDTTWQDIPPSNELEWTFSDTTRTVIFAKYRSSSLIESDLVADGIQYVEAPPTGSINVSSSPDGAAVFLDGSSTGLITPASVTEVLDGTHRITVSLPGLVSDPVYQFVTIEGGGTGEADFAFTNVPPQNPDNFVVELVNDTLALSWRNPGDADLQSVVVRYRLDGLFPTHPEDGDSVCELEATPYDTMTCFFVNYPQPGSIYFTAFAIDDSLHSSGTHTYISSGSGSHQDFIPDEFYLHQSYPNPFNPTTNIRYDVAQISHVTLSIYNLLGQQITQLIDKQHLPGSYTMSWNAADQPSGLYFCRMQAGGFVQTQKLVLLK